MSRFLRGRKVNLGLLEAERVYEVAVSRGHDPRLIMTGAIVGAEIFGHAVTYHKEAAIEAKAQDAKVAEYVAAVPLILQRVEKTVNAIMAKIDALKRQVDRVRRFAAAEVAEQNVLAMVAKSRAEFVRKVGEL